VRQVSSRLTAASVVAAALPAPSAPSWAVGGLPMPPGPPLPPPPGSRSAG
jgi:hypothetical protein